MCFFLSVFYHWESRAWTVRRQIQVSLGLELNCCAEHARHQICMRNLLRVQTRKLCSARVRIKLCSAFQFILFLFHSLSISLPLSLSLSYVYFYYFRWPIGAPLVKDFDLSAVHIVHKSFQYSTTTLRHHSHVHTLSWGRFYYDRPEYPCCCNNCIRQNCESRFSMNFYAYLMFELSGESTFYFKSCISNQNEMIAVMVVQYFSQGVKFMLAILFVIKCDICNGKDKIVLTRTARIACSRRQCLVINFSEMWTIYRLSKENSSILCCEDNYLINSLNDHCQIWGCIVE